MILPVLRQHWLTCPNHFFSLSFHRHISILTPSHYLPSANHNPWDEPKTTWRSFAWPSSSSLPNVYSLHDLGEFRLFLSQCDLTQNAITFFPSRVQLYPQCTLPTIRFFPFPSFSFVHPTHTSAHGAHDLPFSLVSSSHSFRPCFIFAQLIFS